MSGMEHPISVEDHVSLYVVVRENLKSAEVMGFQIL